MIFFKKKKETPPSPAPKKEKEPKQKPEKRAAVSSASPLSSLKETRILTAEGFRRKFLKKKK